MDGQVYVTVEADAATPVTLEAGGSGGGSVSKGATIYWQFDGGITGQYGWDSPRKVNYVDGISRQQMLLFQKLILGLIYLI